MTSCYNYFHVYTVDLSTVEDVLNISEDNVTVNLSWPQEFGVSYDVEVTPTTIFSFTTTSSVQVTMSYNVSYTVIIVGMQCSQNVSRAVKELRYGELT